MSAKGHKYYWASFAVYEPNGPYWGFRELVFVDQHPFELPDDNWKGPFSLVSFQEISYEDYMRHGEHDPDAPCAAAPGGQGTAR